MSGFALHPRLAADTRHVASLPLCDALLMDDANYPWLILVPRVAGARELLDLGGEDRARLWREIDLAAQALRDLFAPDKLNIAALGNVVPQLHIHHIVRYRTDPAWPAPVWGRVPAVMYGVGEIEKVVEKLRAALGASGLRTED